LAEPLRVEALRADLAQALMQRLHNFPTELSEEEGSCEVRVSLVGDPDRAVVEVLNGVDAWLIEHDLEAVRVHLDKRVYTLTPPRSASTP
jgi:hypothetical protein